jgi:hypothetical protein
MIEELKVEKGEEEDEKRWSMVESRVSPPVLEINLK